MQKRKTYIVCIFLLSAKVKRRVDTKFDNLISCSCFSMKRNVNEPLTLDFDRRRIFQLAVIKETEKLPQERVFNFVSHLFANIGGQRCVFAVSRFLFL